MPIPGGELEPDVMVRGELAPVGAHETDKEEKNADDDVGAMKAGAHEEGGAIDRVLEAEWCVDVFVTLGEDEQHAKRDAECKKELELRAVSLAQLIMGHVDRGA